MSTQKLMNQIKFDYGNDAYAGLTGDRRFEHVSPKLNRLWGVISSPEELSIHSLDMYYRRSKRNLVHVKLCLKDDIKIDKSTCEVVISDFVNAIIKVDHF